MLGASDVNVGGSLYDAGFPDEKYIASFNRCDEMSDLAFRSSAADILTSQALLDQVFLDSASRIFDTSAQLTEGCVSSSRCIKCDTGSETLSAAGPAAPAAHG